MASQSHHLSTAILLLLLLLPTVSASSLQRTLRSSNSPSVRHRPHQVSVWYPTTLTSTPTIIYRSSKTKCPCYLKYSFHSETYNRNITTSFIVLTERNYQTYAASNFKTNLIFNPIHFQFDIPLKTSNTETSTFAHSPSQMNIQTAGDYRLVIVAKNSTSSESFTKKKHVVKAQVLLRPQFTLYKDQLVQQPSVVGDVDVTFKSVRNRMVALDNLQVHGVRDVIGSGMQLGSEQLKQRKDDNTDQNDEKSKNGTGIDKAVLGSAIGGGVALITLVIVVCAALYCNKRRRVYHDFTQGPRGRDVDANKGKSTMPSEQGLA